MVAIVSGNGMGLDLTSRSVLGGQGVQGDPGQGQGGEKVYVNAANGNLVLQQLQDHLVGLGPDIDSILTYNSQGLRNDDNGDNFSLGMVPAQLVLSGTVNTGGSTVTVTAFDGSQQVYAWDGARYVSTAGDGAYDTITYANAKYTRVDGATQETAAYDGTSGRLLSRTDAQGNKITFGYTGSLLTSVSNADTVGGVAHGETVFYDYNAGSQLTAIRKQTDLVDGGGNFTGTTTQTLVTYAYDTSNRLKDVVVDLTPADGATSDGKVFKTSFTYDASSRVYTVSQSDGTSLTILYDASSRVQSITDAVGTATTFVYDTTGKKTSVTVNGQGAAGLTTVYGYDGATGQLTSVTSPPPVPGAPPPVTTFAYDANGDVTAISDGAGRTVRTGYDANGNLVSRLDADGNQTLYTYDTKNRLLTQTTSTLATPAMTSMAGVSISGGTVSKSGSVAGWNAAAYGATGIAGGAAVSFTAARTTGTFAVGLTADPGAAVGYEVIDWAIRCTAGTLQASENGVVVDLGGTYAVGDTLGVRYDGFQVSYLKNGQVLRSVAASIDDPLYAASAFYDPGARIDNLRFGAASNDDADVVDLQGVPVLAPVGSITVAGDTATKTGSATAWDSSVRSTVGLVGGAAASATVTSTDKNVMLGLDSAAGDDAGYTSIDYAMCMRSDDGNLYVYIGGDQIAMAGAFHAGDRVSVAYDGANTVSWLHNGAVVYSYTTPAVLTQALYLDSSFQATGASLASLRFGGFGSVDPVRQKTPPVMANSGGVSINGGTLTKTGGVNGAWDASARSALGLSGGAQVAFTVATAGKDLSVGLNSDPDSSLSYTSLDYAFMLTAGNKLQAWSNGVQVGADLGTYAVGDRLVLRSDGANVTWTVNGTVLRATAVVGSGMQPLYVDTAFSTAGGAIADLIFDSGNPVSEATPLPVIRAWRTSNLSATSSGTFTKNGGTDGAWDAATRSANGIVGGAAVAFTATSTTTQLAIGLSALPDADNTWQSIDFACYLDSDGTFSARQHGVVLANLGAYVAGDRLSVVSAGDRISWLKNGKAVYTAVATVNGALYADSSFCSANAKVTNLCFGSSDMADPFADNDAPALKTVGGIVVVGGDVAKSGGTDGQWDSSVRSRYAFVGGATASFTVETPSRGLMAGLSKNPDPSSGWPQLDYAFYLVPDGSLQVAEDGVLTSLNQTYAAGDRFSVSYDGRQVIYVKNGQVLRSVAVTITPALYLGSSFLDAGAKISDLDFAGGASTDQTTRYVYSDDGKGRLRYVISAAGRVTEYGYTSGALTSTNDYVQASCSMAGLASSVVPTEADMNAWRAMQDLTLTQRTTIGRDWRQQVSSTVTYTTTNTDGSGAPGAAATTNYVYDPSGRLLQKTQGAAVTTYVYDGLGRSTLVTDPLARTTATQYDDANSKITITSANATDATQRVKTEIFDRAGRLVSVTSSGTGLAAATTTYDYDAAGHLLRTTDPTGVKTWALYDADGRKVADIDGEGVLTGYDYDASKLLTRQFVHATKLDATTLGKLVDANGKPCNPTLATLGVSYAAATDQVTWHVYDAAGRLRQSIDALGAVTQVDYDGAGRIVSTTAFATRINPATLSATVAPTLRTMTPAAGDRITRNYYDDDGLLAATQDADRYLTAWQYDGKGRLTTTIRYATKVQGANVASTLDQLLPAPAVDDQRSVTLYDRAGRVSGQVDAEGCLTENTYDNSDNLLKSTRYATQVGTAVDAGSTVDSIRPVTSSEDRTTSFSYDAGNRVAQQTGYEGTLTRYAYAANSDDLVSSDVAPGQGDESQSQRRVDALGRVAAALSGVGSSLITTGMTQAQVDAIWAQYGVDYAYDLAGRRTSMTDALGNVTRYFYDNDNRLRYTVDATGATTELQYDAFGQVTKTLRYATPIPGATSIGSGGLITSALTTAVATLGAPTTTTTAYLLDGLAKSVTDALGYTVTNTSYDAFGDVLARQTGLSGGRVRIDDFSYDNRGDQLTSEMDHGGLASVTSSAQFDAFGRQVRRIDGNGQVVDIAYDRLGNVIRRTDPLNPASTWTYDAFGQVKSASKAGADPTTTTYVLAANSMTVTPPGLPGTVTVRDDLGRVSTVTDANQVKTTYTYDDDGHLTKKTIAGTVTFTASYDAAGNMVTSQDGRGFAAGAWTYYTYDADNRLQYAVDPTGGVTYHEYDALGREVRVTRYVAKIQAMPANGVAISSSQVAVGATAGVDQVTTRRFDGDGHVTYEVDGTGAVTKYSYGDNGTLLQRWRYNNLISLASWDIATDPPAAASPGNDRVERWAYDALDRMTLAVDASGTATQYAYDANGNVKQVRQLANSVPSGGVLRVDNPGTDQGAVLWLGTFGAHDVVTATVRFKGDPTQLGELSLGDGSDAIHGSYTGQIAGTNGWVTLTVTFTVGAAPQSLSVGLYAHNAGAAFYDNLRVTSAAKGVVTDTTFDSLPLGTASGQWSVNSTTVLNWLTPANAGTDAQLQQFVASITDDARDHVTRNVYDADGRKTLSVDPTGAATQYAYDANGNVTQVRQYANAVPSGATMRVNYVAGTNSSAQMLLGSFSAGDVVTATIRFKAAPDTLGQLFVGNVNDYVDEQSSAVMGNDGWQTMTVRVTVGKSEPLWVYIYGDRDGPQHAAGHFVLYDNLRVTSVQRGLVADENFAAVQSGGGVGQWGYDSSVPTTYVTPADAGTDAQLQALVDSMADPSRDRVTRHVYDANNRMTLSVDPAGAATSYAYDGKGNVTRVRQYANAVPSGATMRVNYVAGTNSSAQMLLGSFSAGDVVTATIRFKAAPDTLGQLFVGNVNDYVDEQSSAVMGNDGWQTMTVRVPVGKSEPLWVYIYGDRDGPQHAAGHFVLYDNLRVTSVQRGLVADENFAAVQSGGGVGQWGYDSSVPTTYVTPADAGTDARLQALVDSMADPSRDRITVNDYDGLDRLTWTTDPLGRVTQIGYDATGNVTSRTQYLNTVPTGTDPKSVDTAGGRVSRYVYDGANRQIYSSDPRGVVVGTTYDGAGNAVSATRYATLMPGVVPTPVTTSAQDRTRAMTYDGAGRVLYAMDGLRFVTGYAYDAFGDQTTATRYFTPLAGSLGNSLSQVTANTAQDLVSRQYFNTDGLLYMTDDGVRTHYAYDSFGRLAYTVAADGGVTHVEYDADGRVTRTTAYAATISVAGMPTRTEPGVLATLVTASPGQDALTVNEYDAFGQLRYSMDGTGAISELRYDAQGNVTDRIGYASLPSAAWNGTGAPAIVADAAHDRHVHASYDAFGDVLAQADGTGAVVVNTYDAAGQLTDKVGYANPVALAGWTSGTLPATLVADPSRDIRQRFEYDSYGELAYEADGTGAITALQYDGGGNLTLRTARWNAAQAGATLASIAPAGSDRNERWEFDAFGALAWHSDATGALTGTTYDLGGRATATTQFATPAPGAITHPAATAGLDRTTAMAYDSFGRLQYKTDAMGYVTMTTYDIHGRVLTQVQFRDRQAVPADPTAAPLTVNTYDQKTSFAYDAAGRLKQRTDAEGGVRKTTYDGLGNKTTFTDEKSQLWTYAYDADGRELSETSPTVPVTTNVVNSGGDLQNVDRTVALLKTWRYDGAGNLTQCIEGQYPSSSGIDASDARTTRYDYDAAGRRITTTRQAFDAYNEQGWFQGTLAPVERTVYDAFGNAVAAVDALGHVSYRSYDQANRLRFTIDALGYVVGYARSIFGELKTQTAYGLAPSQIGGGAPSAGNPPMTNDVQTAVDALAPATNRVTSYAYYKNGLVNTITGSAGNFYGYAAGSIYALGTTPTTVLSYDAFGDLIGKAVLYNANSGYYGTTRHYYDLAGNETDTVDAGDYLTHRDYDAFGNATTTTEWANLTSGWAIGVKGGQPAASTTATPGGPGVDRVTTTVYDRLDRKTSQTRNVDYSLNDNDVVSGTGLTTLWHYDAQGHVTYMKDAALYSTYYMYDALGNLRATIAPARSSTVDGASITPVTEYAYDAFGERTYRVDRATGATGVSEFKGAWTAGGANGYTVGADAGDHVTRTQYDRGGNAVQVDDPMAAATAYHNTVNRYTVAGQLSYTTHQNFGNDGTQAAIYQRNVYDAKGQLIHSDTPSTDTSQAAHDVSTDYHYDAFGEVDQKGINGGAQEFFRYNNNGQLWMTNSGTGGVVHAYLHDMAGNVVSDATSEGYGHGNGDLSGYLQESGVANNIGTLRAVNTQGDRLGNSVAVAQPTRSVDAGLIMDVAAKRVRLLAPNDPGSTVSFSYVVGTTTVRPTLAYDAASSTWYFDVGTLAANVTYACTTTVRLADGTLVLSRDGAFRPDTAQTPLYTPTVNQVFDRWGNVLSRSDPRSGAWLTRYTYNANNQVTSRVLPDAATGGASATSTAYFYDRAGNQVAIKDERGYVSGQRYDATGQVIETDQHPATNVLVKTTRAYDIFGRLVQSVAANGFDATTGAALSNVADYTTQFTYDALDHLLSCQQGVGSGNVTVGSGTTKQNLRQEYTYDADGNRLASWDGTLGADGATHQLTQYAYDTAGHLIRTTLPSITISGQAVAPTTRYLYDDFGHEKSQTDANGKTATWSYDYFGVLRGNAHTDFGGTATTYAVDRAGQVYQQTSAAGQNLNYSFDAAGQVTGILDKAVGENTSYVYDAAGRHLQETTAVNGQVFQDNHLSYDDRGLLVDSTDANTHVSYQYDAVGNRYELHVRTFLNGQRTVDGTEIDTDSDRFFKYDGMNRQVHVNWQSDTQAGANGHTLTYDADGNRLSDTFTNNLVTATGAPAITGYASDGKPIYAGFGVTPTYAAAGGTVTELYSYDADDRLSQTLYSVNDTDGGTTTPGYVVIDNRAYDSAGRMVSEYANLPKPGKQTGTNGTAASFQQWLNAVDSSRGLVGLHLEGSQATNLAYDNDGRVVTVSAGSVVGGGYTITYTHDAVGNVVASDEMTRYRDSGGYQHTLEDQVDLTVIAAESYQTTGQTSHQDAERELASGGWQSDKSTETSATSYDPNGHIKEVTNTTLATQWYVSDAQGRLLRNYSDAPVGKELRNLVIDGEAIGQYGVDEAAAQGNAQTAAFGFGFALMDDSSVQTGNTTIVAQGGETLQQAAQAAYGDSRSWTRLASANGLGGDARLQEGQRLVIAGSSGQSYNSHDTFQTSDWGAMLGVTAAELRVSDPVMSPEERGNYYKDVYNRPPPEYTAPNAKGAASAPFGIGSTTFGTGTMLGGDAFAFTAANASDGAIAAAIPSFLALGQATATVSSAVAVQMFAAAAGLGTAATMRGQPALQRNFSDRNVTSVGELEGAAFGNAVGSSLANSENSPSYGGQPVNSIGIEPLTPSPMSVDVNSLLPGPVNVVSDDNANPMPNGSIDSILRREGVNDGSPYTWGKVSGNVTRTEGGNTTQMGEFKLLNGVTDLDNVSGSKWYKLPIAGTYDGAAAEAAYQGQAQTWLSSSNNELDRFNTLAHIGQQESNAAWQAQVDAAYPGMGPGVDSVRPAVGSAEWLAAMSPQQRDAWFNGPRLEPYDAKAAAAQAAQQQYNANSLAIALAGPVLGAGGIYGRMLGAPESTVSALTESSTLAGLAFAGMPEIGSGGVSPVDVFPRNGTPVSTSYAFNSFENPGPLAAMRGTPASNFYGGQYDATVLSDDLVLYRAGDGAPGKELGQWFTRVAPDSVAQVRIDTAVQPQWINRETGSLDGTSPVNTVYSVLIPKGTTIYQGPVGPQGGVYVGGPSTSQIFVPQPWNIPGVQVLGSTPLH